ncbi:hypothetical protein pipiens_005714 [Culex pipiens pipiens]|uniref:Uncharacterized protein n=1 Tax=Culex pipiens pipiens TaxID=38569 RepID=A0ABD1DWN7_CULPP
MHNRNHGYDDVRGRERESNGAAVALPDLRVKFRQEKYLDPVCVSVSSADLRKRKRKWKKLRKIPYFHAIGCS